MLHDRLELFLLENDFHGGFSLNKSKRPHVELPGGKISLVSIVHNSVTDNQVRITIKPRDGKKSLRMQLRSTI